MTSRSTPSSPTHCYVDSARLKVGEPCYQCGKVVQYPLSHMCKVKDVKPSSATEGERIAVRRQLLMDAIHVIRCLVDQCDECNAIAKRYAPDGVYSTLEWVTSESSTLREPVETRVSETGEYERGLEMGADMCDRMARSQREWEENSKCETRGAADILDGAAFAIRALKTSRSATAAPCSKCGKTPPFPGGTRCQDLQCPLINWKEEGGDKPWSATKELMDTPGFDPMTKVGHLAMKYAEMVDLASRSSVAENKWESLCPVDGFNIRWISPGGICPVDIPTTGILLREINRLRGEIMKNFSARSATAGWTPVSEELPPRYTTVAVCDKDDRGSGALGEAGWRWDFSPRHPTHWMALPDIPESYVNGERKP